MVVVQEVHNNCLAILSGVFIKRAFESQLLLQVMIILLLVAQFKKHMNWHLYVYGGCARYVIYCTVGYKLLQLGHSIAKNAVRYKPEQSDG